MVAVDVLEHLRDCRGVLETQMLPAIAPGGVLVENTSFVVNAANPMHHEDFGMDEHLRSTGLGVVEAAEDATRIWRADGASMTHQAPQPEADHYRDAAYNTKERICCYWHQVDEVLSLGARTALEVGPGPGIVTEWLRKAGVEVTTLDMEERLEPDVVGFCDRHAGRGRRL